MTNSCEQIKTEYENLKTLTEEFDLEYQKAVETGKMERVREMKVELEEKRDEIKEKLFVSQSAIASDRAYLYQLLKDRFNFFQSEGWEQNPDYGSCGVVNVFDIKAPENSSAEKRFFGPRETVEFAFGKAPERAKWPEVRVDEIKEKTEINLEEMERLEEFKNIFEQDLGNLGKDVGDFCAFERK